VFTVPLMASDTERDTATGLQEAADRVKVARKAGRYSLRLPVQFSWRDEQGTRRTSAGSTRDISPAGSYIISEQCPQIGAAIKYQVRLPSQDGQGEVELVLRAAGHVIRCELLNGMKLHGFAVLGNRFAFGRATTSDSNN